MVSSEQAPAMLRSTSSKAGQMTLPVSWASLLMRVRAMFATRDTVRLVGS